MGVGETFEGGLGTCNNVYGGATGDGENRVLTFATSSIRVAPVPGHGRPRVVQSAVQVTVTPAPVVLVCGCVGGRRPPTGPHGHGQHGDLFGRPRLERRLAAPPAGIPKVVIFVAEVHPATPRAARRRVDAAGPATPWRVGGRRLDGCGSVESSGKQNKQNIMLRL